MWRTWVRILGATFMTFDGLTVTKVKVFVVAASDWDYYEIKAMFLSKARAEAFIAAEPNEMRRLAMGIEEHELDIQP